MRVLNAPTTARMRELKRSGNKVCSKSELRPYWCRNGLLKPDRFHPDVRCGDSGPGVHLWLGAFHCWNSARATARAALAYALGNSCNPPAPISSAGDVPRFDDRCVRREPSAQCSWPLPKPQTSGAKSDGRFGKQDFAYLPEEDAYRCPAGERLPYRFTSKEDGKRQRRYWTTACQNCLLKSQCTTGPERRITRWEHEHLLEAVQERLA